MLDPYVIGGGMKGGMVSPLITVVSHLELHDPDATIYVAKPWTVESSSLVDFEPTSGGLPEAALRNGMKYFLEVDVAREFLANWQAALHEQPNDQERCARLICYAVNDA